MIVTINTDASFSNSHKVGTYAFWISTNYGKFKRYGVLRGKMPSSLYAETKAIGNAVAFLYEKSGLVNHVRKIIINTDCYPAIHLLTKNHKANATHSSLRNNVLSVINSVGGVKKEFRHVKAHTNTKNARSYVNNWCDRHAKLAMKNKLKKMETE